MKKVLVIDNFDSFVYNLVHYLEEFGCSVDVLRNNEIDLDDIEKYDKILLSPGPGLPKEAGKLNELITTFAASKDIFGICLGQQAIAEAFGGTLVNLDKVFHGVSSTVDLSVDDEPIFLNLKKHIQVGRYHSWVVEKNLPSCLEATSVDASGQIMSLRHKNLKVKAVQFHPESILTPDGKKIIQNWVDS